MSIVANTRNDFEFLRSFLPLLASLSKIVGARPVDYSDTLERHFRERPDQPVLIGEASAMTWGELDTFANRVAHWALSQGLARGDVVALLMENRPEFIGTWLGLSRVGVVSALFNTNLSGERLAHCAREAGTRHWIVGVELAEAAGSALGELAEAPQVFVAGTELEPVADPASIPAVLSRAVARAEPFDALCAAARATAIDPGVRKGRLASDGIFLIYTSGTTGLPKAAKISHTKAIAAGLCTSKFQRLTPDDRGYCCLPLYHTAGGLLSAGGALLSGGSLVVVRKFSTKRFWSDCTRHRVTWFQYIGELCRYLLNSPADGDERRHVIRSIAGNGLRPEVWGPFQERFQIPRILEMYGATEGSLPLLNASGRLGAVGQLPRLLRKVLGFEIVRFDVEHEDVVRGADGFCQRCGFDEPGELLVRITNKTPFEGYTNEGATRKKVLRNVFAQGDAYFRTGDLLRLDSGGFYYFVDRIGDTFRWKGENVATSEVAQVISSAAGVEEANVYGVAVAGTDGRAGMAALVTNDAFDLEALGKLVDEQLASYARPLFIRILPQMEITATFKHRKVDLVREGFDPARLDDQLYFRDPDKGCYVPLDVGVHERIEAGEVRL
ncbi:MAG: long-chain-acyl-CoA synthetase [bacterium]|nr:long-chain-acyl-CoA synthetase [bacterium]